MTTISATSILASRHAVTGDRLDTLLLRYPRWIHAEFMTHRVFSRNASSSRAIPVEKLVQDVLDDPAVPLFWGKNQKGMQAGEECRANVRLPSRDIHMGELLTREETWLRARDNAVTVARGFSNAGYHKQIVNRLLEPFSHITVVCSSTNWSNFLALRDHPDAEPHIQILAAEIRNAVDDAIVQELQPGDWHLPFASRAADVTETFRHDENASIEDREKMLMKLSAARCASTSYKTVDGFDMTIERAVELVDKLIGSTPLHASPFEHVAQADEVLGDEGWGCCVHPEQHGNFTGFCQWRKMLPNESL
jgi:hypothetical protein